MANFVMLYSGGGMPEGEAQQAAELKEWTAWYTRLGSAVVDPGNPFTPIAKSIASNGKISNGPVGTMSTGYSILKADNINSATEMARGCPVLKSGGQISVFETFPAM